MRVVNAYAGNDPSQIVELHAFPYDKNKTFDFEKLQTFFGKISIFINIMFGTIKMRFRQ